MGSLRGLAGRLATFVEREPELADAARLAQASGCRILLVGGAIRDLILGRPVKDLDFILDGPGRRFLRALSQRLGHRVVTFRKRGIVDHRIRTGAREWDFVERGQRSLQREILRRDFSMNALALDLVSGTLHDPAGGLHDLARRRIRAISAGIFKDDPLRMLRALRLRAEVGELLLARATAAMIRRDAALICGVSVERIKSEMDRILSSVRASQTIALMDRLGLLRHVLPELDPLRGLAQNRYHHLDAFRHTLAALAAADDPRVLARGLPVLAFAVDPLEGPGGDPQGGPQAPQESPRSPAAPSPRARASTPARAAARVARSAPPAAAPSGLCSDLRAGSRALRPTLSPERARLLRWAVLLHDTGKAVTRTLGDDGEYHFYLHERDSARIARAVLRRLRAPRAEIVAVEALVALHLRLSIPPVGGMTPRALRRIVRDAGALTPLLVLHSLADKIASRGPAHARTLARLRRAGTELLGAWHAEAERARRAPALVNGHNVMEALGLAPGPEVGRVLLEIEELQASGELRTHAQALAWLRRGARGTER